MRPSTKRRLSAVAVALNLTLLAILESAVADSLPAPIRRNPWVALLPVFIISTVIVTRARDSMEAKHSASLPTAQEQIERYGQKTLKEVRYRSAIAGFRETARSRFPVRIKVYVPVRGPYQRVHEPNQYDSRELYSLFGGELLRAVLITGDPGSGKTRLLLELAQRSSQAESRKSHDSRTALVWLDLVEWDGSPMDQWLARSLKHQASIPPEATIALLEQNRLFLIFDGLDEVSDAKRRADCVRELRQFRQGYGLTAIAIASRPTREGSERELGMPIVEVLPLEDRVVNAILAKNGRRSGLSRDPTIREMLRNPFFLSVAIRTDWTEPPAEALPAGRHQERLIDAYISDVLHTRGNSLKYSSDLVMRCLAWIARILELNGSSFYTGIVSPTHLGVTRRGDLKKRIFGLVLGVGAAGLGFGLGYIIGGPILGGFTASISLLTIVLAESTKFEELYESTEVDTLGWSWKKLSADRVRIAIRTVVAALIALAFYYYMARVFVPRNVPEDRHSALLRTMPWLLLMTVAALTLWMILNSATLKVKQEDADFPEVDPRATWWSAAHFTISMEDVILPLVVGAIYAFLGVGCTLVAQFSTVVPRKVTPRTDLSGKFSNLTVDLWTKFENHIDAAPAGPLFRTWWWVIAAAAVGALTGILIIRVYIFALHIRLAYWQRVMMRESPLPEDVVDFLNYVVSLSLLVRSGGRYSFQHAILRAHWAGTVIPPG